MSAKRSPSAGRFKGRRGSPQDAFEALGSGSRVRHCSKSHRRSQRRAAAPVNAKSYAAHFTLIIYLFVLLSDFVPTSCFTSTCCPEGFTALTWVFSRDFTLASLLDFASVVRFLFSSLRIDRTF